MQIAIHNTLQVTSYSSLTFHIEICRKQSSNKPNKQVRDSVGPVGWILWQLPPNPHFQCRVPEWNSAAETVGTKPKDRRFDSPHPTHLRDLKSPFPMNSMMLSIGLASARIRIPFLLLIEKYHYIEHYFNYLKIHCKISLMKLLHCLIAFR